MVSFLISFSTKNNSVNLLLRTIGSVIKPIGYSLLLLSNEDEETILNGRSLMWNYNRAF